MSVKRPVQLELEDLTACNPAFQFFESFKLSLIVLNTFASADWEQQSLVIKASNSEANYLSFISRYKI